MKKFIVLIVIIIFCLFQTPNIAFAEETNKVKIIYSNANIYALPDSNSEVIEEYSYGKTLILFSTNIIVGTDKLNYYNVVLDETTSNVGYILCSHVILKVNDSPNKILETNGTINKDSEIYVLNQSDIIGTEKVIPSGTKIKVISEYNKSKEFTLIQYTEQDGSIASVYIKTSDIDVGGVPTGTISAIIIIIATVSLILILFGIKGKKKKRKAFKK